MGLRTSVTGCITLLGVVTVATGCAGRVPGQASAIDLRAMAPAASKTLVAMGGDAKAADALKAMAQAPAAKLALDAAVKAAAKPAEDGDAAKTEAPAAEKAGVEPPAAMPAPADAAPAIADATAKAPEAIAAEPAPAAAAEVEAAAAKAATDPASAAPDLGFTIPSLTDLAAALTTTETPVLFQDTFDDGLAAWVSRGLGAPAAAGTADDAVVLATSRARRSLWIKTRTEIDLAGSAQPRLRLDFKGQATALKAVWETDNGDFPEEILLTPAEAAEGAAADAPPEFDLAALKGRPGHLVLVARAPKGTGTAPVLDAVTIYDAKDAATEL